MSPIYRRPNTPPPPYVSPGMLRRPTDLVGALSRPAAPSTNLPAPGLTTGMRRKIPRRTP